MSLLKFNQFLDDYGVQGGIVTLVATYVLFATDNIFVVPALDTILMEKILVFIFGVIFLAIIYIFHFFERKKSKPRRHSQSKQRRG